MRRALLVVSLAAVACADPPPRAPQSTTTAVPEAGAAAQEDDDELVAEEPTEPRSEPATPPPPPDYHAQAVKDAATVLRNLQPAFRECYGKRLKQAPKAHGNVTIDVLIGPGGKVRSVDTTGGAILGEKVLDCIAENVKNATFSPPHGGGTLRIKVPFAFRATAKDAGR